MEYIEKKILSRQISLLCLDESAVMNAVKILLFSFIFINWNLVPITTDDHFIHKMMF